MHLNPADLEPQKDPIRRVSADTRPAAPPEVEHRVRQLLQSGRATAARTRRVRYAAYSAAAAGLVAAGYLLCLATSV